MVILFFISCLLFLFTVFGAGFSFSFKEVYKEYYKMLFVRKGYKRPYDWPYSRQKNHNEFIEFITLTIVFFILTVICGVMAKMWAPLLVISFVITPLLIKIGTDIGEKECHRALKESCEKFKLDIEWEKEKNLQVLLEIFHLKWIILIYFKVYCFFNLLTCFKLYTYIYRI